MSTPKTPFRGRRSTEEMPGSRGEVVGVVSRDSNDATEDSQGTPQPSPLQPPAQQMRVVNKSTDSKASGRRSQSRYQQQHQSDTESVGATFPSSFEVRPPSPYSPPAESLWSENTEDQWPFNHTKRNFRKPGPNHTDALASAKSSRRREDSHSRIASAGSPNIPPLEEVAMPYEQEPYDQESEFDELEQGDGVNRNADARTPALTSERRKSHVPTPSSSRVRYNERPSAEDALFLLQEEHKILQTEYHELDHEWKEKCDILEEKLAEQGEMMERLQSVLTERNNETDETRAFLEYARTGWEEERNGLQAQFERQLEEKNVRLEALQKEKDELEAEILKLRQSAEALMDGQKEHENKLLVKNKVLEEQQEVLKKKLDRYENEIVCQSKRILQLEEALEQAKKVADNDVRSIQSEALALGNDWKAEKQTLQEEIRRLKEKLVEKDLETTKFLDDQRRQQVCQVRDLERQVANLTNNLAEYQGRHRELRATVDQHLTLVVAPPKKTESVACQTDVGMEGSSSPAEEMAESIQSLAEPSPSTPSVRFVESGNSNRSTGSTPVSALRNHPRSLHLPTRTTRSASPVSPSPSEHLIPPTADPTISPWIPIWQGRSIHTRADPPPSSTPQSVRNLSPPVASYSTGSPTDEVRLAPPPLSVVEKERSIHDDRAADQVPSPPTERVSNVDRAAARRREQKEKEKKELEAMVDEKVRSYMGDQLTREALEATIQDLRKKLEQKEISNSSNLRQETNELLEEIQRECNLAFQRGKMRRTSPRTVVHTFFKPSVNTVEEDQDFLVNENWELSVSENDNSSKLSVPELEKSLTDLADLEGLVRDL